MKKLSLTTQIAIALVLAVVAGLLLADYPDFVNEYIKPWGTIFLNLLKFIVAPLVLFSIMAGILSMNDVKKVGSLGLRALAYFMFTTVIAITVGLVFPSAGIPIEGVAVAAGIDRIVDMGRTVMSITGDASCAVVLQKQMGEKS